MRLHSALRYPNSAEGHSRKIIAVALARKRLAALWPYVMTGLVPEAEMTSDLVLRLRAPVQPAVERQQRR